MSRHDKKPTAEQVKNLTASEVVELTKFLSDLHAKDLALQHELNIADAERNLRQLTDAIKAGATVNDETVRVIYSGLDDVARALKKAGYVKPKQSMNCTRVDPDQMNLIPESIPIVAVTVNQIDFDLDSIESSSLKMEEPHYEPKTIYSLLPRPVGHETIGVTK